MVSWEPMRDPKKRLSQLGNEHGLARAAAWEKKVLLSCRGRMDTQGARVSPACLSLGLSGDVSKGRGQQPTMGTLAQQ